MRARQHVLPVLLVLTVTALQASSLVQVQLRGLRGVNTTVFVSRDLPDSGVMEKEIQNQVKEVLARDGGLATDGPNGVWLSVTVDGSKVDLCDGALLIRVRVEFSEGVHLTRNPEIAVERAVTWARDWAGIESRESFRQAIKTQVDLQVGSFAADVKTTEQYQHRKE